MDKKVWKKLIPALFLTTVLSLSACGSSGSEKSQQSNPEDFTPVVLRYSTMMSTDHISYSIAQEIAEEVKEATDGRVTIEIYPANQLGDWTQVYDELMMGSIDMAHSSVPETYNPKIGVGYFPYLATDFDELGTLFAQGGFLWNSMEEMQAQQGVKFLGFFCEGLCGVATTKPLDNYNNLDPKGIKIRSAAMDVYLKPLEFMGFDTASINSSDTFAAIQTGVVDGYAGNTAMASYLNYRDLIKYYYVYNVNPEVTQVMMSQKTYDKLLPADAAAIEEICSRKCIESLSLAQDLEEEYYQKLEDAGVEVIRFTDEELDYFASQVRENVWPQLAETYTPEFISELQASYN